MKKLVLFGDSLLANCGKHLVLKLEETLIGQFDVYNCAAGGWDTDNLINKSEYIASLKPDVLVLSVGTNDAAPWKRVDLSTFKENLPGIIKNFSDSDVIYFLPPPVTEGAVRPEGKIILNSDIKPYYDAAKDICEQLAVKYVDSWAVFMPLQENAESYHVEDGVHLNDHGYEVLFKEIAKVLT